jgi:hypothetical protein
LYFVLYLCHSDAALTLIRAHRRVEETIAGELQLDGVWALKPLMNVRTVATHPALCYVVLLVFPLTLPACLPTYLPTYLPHFTVLRG